jgi:hypothetical protein
MINTDIWQEESIAGRSAETHEIRRLTLQVQNVTDQPVDAVTEMFHTNISILLQAYREVFKKSSVLLSDFF